jgi:hypothetical protein
MWKRIVLFAVLVIAFSCKNDEVEKPDRLIEKELMVDIMYDVSLLEAVKYQNFDTLQNYNIDATKYILKKYKVDSLQYVQSNIYYAYDYKGYKEMFDEVAKRIENKKAAIDSLVNNKNKKSLKTKTDSIKKTDPSVKN